MKRIIYSLLAAGMVFSSCQKENRNATPATMEASISDADFTFSKATTGENKKNNTDLDLSVDYDLVIKEVSQNKFKLKVKLGGIVAKGKAIAGKTMANSIYAVTTTIKGPKLEGIEQLNLTLKSTGRNGDVFEFAEFEYKGDLDYELLEVSSSFRIGGGNVVFTSSSSVKILESTITVDNGNFKPGNDFTIKEGTTVVFNQEKMETSFAILFGSAENECRLVDDGSFFLLPNGHTVVQDPRIKKVQFTKINEGGVAIDNPIFTGVNDPMGNVLGLLYTPPPVVDPANPELTIQPEPILLKPTFRNANKGVVRFEVDWTDASGHFKKADFNPNGPGWARLTMLTEL